MNHIGNANKMVSETPISDSTPHNVADLGMQIRRLERQLTAANSKIELLMSANADVARIAGERDAAEKRIKRLEAVTNDPSALWINWLRGDVTLPVGIGDVRQYQDRIKRLEEELMDSKNKHAVLIADVVLNEDRAEQIKRLRKANLQLREGAEEQKQRIKRLEKACGEMVSEEDTYIRLQTWLKAKEDKP
jgi:hypothetical protein